MMPPSPLSPSILPEVAAIQNEMVALRRQIHAHPELAYEEIHTGDLVAERLQAWGYSVHRGLGGTGVVGQLRLGSGQRRLGLRADMDALPIQETTDLPYASRLPGKMHACGHDGHTATLLAAARVLAERGRFDGTLNLIFQPAEEGHGGAQRMMTDGLFDRFPCDAIYSFHNEPGYPAGQFGFRSGVMYSSSDTVILTVSGEGGHGAMPHVAVDPIVAAAHIVLALQTIVSREIDPNDMAVVTIGAIHGGDAPNVIPASVELRLTVRARLPHTRQLLRERITTIAQQQAAVHRARVEVDYRWRYPPVINDEAATRYASSIARQVLGDAALIADLQPLQASDDFAFMLEAVPGSYFIVGNGEGEGGCMVHNSGYDFNDALLPRVASYWVHLAEHFLGDPQP
ncbi:M20 aminoacylase family protein [Bordetella avium]|uniref:Probable amidohydrolase/peptidase n=1 Tax=Bordetella avium (strain 197N) TaxID=360910 RepID=Q2KUC6_BORA1|nr:M20 aminoacylase family protein [Bordetella avium]AZY53855.1 amidohydrolase [Bordetella avium]RIQ15372.1 amidohydrolase [Bordetella avium]RIQ19822.1 amidohydrolase [Bordetella avium]RIQ34402.1 amidohydrolase [Bordetella avium]RIQ38518.1 amidohydrolase [Bordetella avium]